MTGLGSEDIACWLERLVAGAGRHEQLTGQQRHFLRVIDGTARPLGVEKQWLAEYQRMRPARDEPASATAMTTAVIVVPRSQIVVAVEPAHEARHPEARQQGADSRFADTVRSATHAAAAEVIQGARAVGNALDVAKKADGQVAGLVEGTVALTGGAVATVGTATAKGAREVRRAVGAAAEAARRAIADRDEPHSEEWTWGQVLRKAASVAIGVGEVAGKAVAGATELAAVGVTHVGVAAVDGAKATGRAAAGAYKGTLGLIGGAADTVGITDDDIQRLREQIETAVAEGAQERQRYLHELKAHVPDDRERLIEQVTIGGLSIAAILAGKEVPPEVVAAYQAAFPVESQVVDFADKVQELASSAELGGLVNAVKGKLFELQYLDELNHGALPDGWSAALAESATKPGWDIAVTDANGATVDWFSLKATEHVSYVREALDRYPDIDVVTTSEVYGQLASTPEGAHLIDGGISNVELGQVVSDAADGVDGGLGAAATVIALGPAAYQHFVASTKSTNQNVENFSEQVSRAKSSLVAGKAAMLLVPYWPVALVSSIGLSMLARAGNDKREQVRRMQAVLAEVESGTRHLTARRRAMLEKFIPRAC